MSKKKLICILMAAACVVCMAACSSDSSTEASAGASAEASENGAADDASAESANFMSWTKSDWDSASSDEKYEAAADVIRQVQAPQTSLVDFVSQAKDDPGLDAEVIEMEGLIEAELTSQEGITIGEASLDVTPMEETQD